MRIAEYKKIDSEIVTEKVMVNDYDEEGNIIGQHEETVTKEIPVMGMVYRDMTKEEIEEMERMQAEIPPQEPTFEDRIEAQVLYTALLTDTLLED